jgi:DNA-binding transcriptional LysR family regulator
VSRAEEMDLNDVRVFVEVVRAQSFTAAGRLLEMPRSTVSRRIANLERHLGARLLHRTTRRLQLTDVGTSFHEQCAASLAAIDDAETRVRASQDTPRGRLRITAPNDMGRYLAPLVARFMHRYPEVVIDAVLSQHMVDLVGEGFDLAIRASSQLPDSSLIARRIAGGAAALYAGPSYLAERGTPCEEADLATHDCIVLGTARTRTWRLLRDGVERSVTVTGKIQVNDPSFARELIVQNLGIGLIPDFLAEGLVETEDLVRVLPNHHIELSNVYVVYPSAKHLSATVRAFRDALVDDFGELTWAASQSDRT